MGAPIVATVTKARQNEGAQQPDGRGIASEVSPPEHSGVGWPTRR